MNWHEPIIKTISKWDISWILHDIAILSSFSHVSITVLSSWMRTKHRTLWGSGPGCASLGLHQNSAKGATVGSHLANEPSSCIWPFFARVFRGKTGLPSYNLDQLRIIKKAWLAIVLSSKKSWKIMVVFFFPELDPEQNHRKFVFFRARLPSQLLGLKVPKLHPAESLQVETFCNTPLDTYDLWGLYMTLWFLYIYIYLWGL